jgi:hypothetical protein
MIPWRSGFDIRYLPVVLSIPKFVNVGPRYELRNRGVIYGPIKTFIPIKIGDTHRNR